MAGGLPPTKTQTFPLIGGLDVESAQFSRQPGLVMGASNYESSPENGYERVGGFERFDGHARPSDATYVVLECLAGISGLVAGDAINGESSGCTGTVIQIRSATQIVVTRVSTAFTIGENIRLVTSVKGIYTGSGTDVTGFDDNTLSALAAAEYRTSIAAVPGSGAMRGIAVLGTTVYAFRDNVGATALAIYKSTSSGWTLVPLQTELSFNVGGGTAPAEGATITKGGTTGVLRRLIVTSGTWGATTAAGRMILDTLVSGPFTVGAFTGGVTATVTVASATLTMSPGGRLDHVVYNFTGSTATERIYGADGVNFGFEFDGTTLVPIRTGMTVDTPTHVTAHRNHLFFSFKGSVQHSSITTPYIWSVATGAAEIAVGQDVTGFSSVPGEVDSAPLIIFSATRTTVIYGTSSADWKLTTFSSSIGAQRWSAQNIGNPVVFSSLGITPVMQSAEFGNFNTAPASERVRRYLDAKIVTASVVNRKLTRLRMFFSDGTGMSVTPVANTLRFMPMSYSSKVINCAVEATISGVSRNFFGSTDGYVYEADVGRSFDGSVIESWIKFAFNHTGSPAVRKRFRKATTEAKGQSAFVLSSSGEYSLGALDVGGTAVTTTSVAGAGGQWDISLWDRSYYDAASQTVISTRIDGVGTDLSLTYYGSKADELPHLLQSTTTQYTPRRLER